MAAVDQPSQEYWRTELSRFLTSGERVLIIPYDGPDLNPRRFWHRLNQRNPFRFLFQVLVIAFTTYMPAGDMKNALLRVIGMKIGKDAMISSGVLFDVEFPMLISVGPGAIIGTNTKILTHEVSIRSVRIGRIELGRQAMVGAYSLLRPGVRVGDGSIVSFHSFVNKDVEDGWFAGGVPAKPVKKMDKLV